MKLSASDSIWSSLRSESAGTRCSATVTSCSCRPRRTVPRMCASKSARSIVIAVTCGEGCVGLRGGLGLEREIFSLHESILAAGRGRKVPRMRAKDRAVDRDRGQVVRASFDRLSQGLAQQASDISLRPQLQCRTLLRMCVT